MAKIRYVTLVEIKEAVMTVVRNADGTYHATLKAAGVSFHGRGKSVRTAAEDTLRHAFNEPRGSDKGRPSKRYRIARSLI